MDSFNQYITERFTSGNFVGESLWIGNLGHLFIVLSFVMSGLAFFAYFYSEFTKNEIKQTLWQKVARWAFIIHGISVFSIFGLLFLMILNHHFEYHYAWQHSSKSLPLKYIVSSFWEGQEGSFLLWQFWHVVLGFVLLKIGKKYERPVVGVLSLAQLLLGSMVLGVFVFGYKVGVNPFVLLRNEMAGAPIFLNPNYLELIKDGNGLNPLLQNYWMVIHPPVLFLGFASTVVPFGFAIGSLIRSDFDKWVKPALPWVLFSAGILGTGIFMGGMWAYESLSFGGFWAWDPVENASFVPWLTLVAGLHTLVAYRYTKRGLAITYLFFIATFILILYSTFLTRSGVLGDTSVHAFTSLGMTGQLLVYLFVLAIPAVILLFSKISKFPKQEKEEAFLSREFWMFIGSLIFLFSAILIGWDTSLPVTNKIFGTNFSIAGDSVEAHYNQYQIVVGILMAIGAASIQFLVYKRGDLPKHFKFLTASALAAIAITILVCKTFEISFFHEFELFGARFTFLSMYWLLMLTSLFAVFSNVIFIFLIQKKRVLEWSSSISHIGFGIFLIGILISQHKQEVISINNAGIALGKEFTQTENQENVLLIKGDTIQMADYEVSYAGRYEKGVDEFFTVNYVKRNDQNEIVEQFTLDPYAQINPNMGLISNPSTKHYFSKDVFTHVTSIPEKPKDIAFEQIEMAVGDTFFTSKHFVLLDSISILPMENSSSDTLVGLNAIFSISGFDDYRNRVEAKYQFSIVNDTVMNPIVSDREANIEMQLLNFDPNTEQFTMQYKDNNGNEDFIIMKAIVFPYIKVLWWGAYLMLFGFFMSMYRRIVKP